MRLSGTSSKSVNTQNVSGRSRLWEVGGVIAALALGYLLLLAVPAVSAHLRSAMQAGDGLGKLGAWVLALGASGLALAGGAALVMVLVQLTAEARRHPYAFLSPLLAAFSACILIGLGAELPLPGIPSAHLAVVALIVAVAGGALIADPRLAVQMTGLALALWPSVTLLIVVWASTGKLDPAAALWSLPPEAMSFVVLLLISSFAIAALGMVVGQVDQAMPAVAVARVETAGRMPMATAVGSSTPLALAVTARFDTPSGQRPVMPRVHGNPPLAPAAPASYVDLARKAGLVLVGVLLALGIGRAIHGASAPPLGPAEISLKSLPASSMPVVVSAVNAAAPVPELRASAAPVHAAREPAPARTSESRAVRSRRQRGADRTRSRAARAARRTDAARAIEPEVEAEEEAYAAEPADEPVAKSSDAERPAAQPVRSAARPRSPAQAHDSEPEAAPESAPARTDDSLDALMTSVLNGQK